jgi:hypothetical protein
MPHNKQFEPTVIRRHVRAASAPLHYALAARWTAQRAAAELRRLPNTEQPMRIRQRLVTQPLLACFVCVLCVPVRAQTAQIAVEVQCHTSADTVGLRVTLRNVGLTDTAVVLGNSIGNGNRYLADSLALDVKLGESAAVEKFEYFDPSVPGVAGRVDPWIVPLPAVSEFSLTRPLSHFSSHGKPLMPGGNPIDVRVSLNARAERRIFDKDVAGVALVHVLVGEFRSEWLRVPTACAVG